MKWALLLMLVFLLACKPVEEPAREAKYDLLEDDVYSLWLNENFTSLDLSVSGVMLGDNRNSIIENLGPPDNFTRFEGDMLIENLEYGKALGLERNGLVIHLEDDKVTRITVNKAFNSLLKGMTFINKSNEDIFFSLGIPDAKEIFFRYILLKYNDFGLDIITFRSDEVALSFRDPSETDRNISTEVDLMYIPYADEIVFT